MRKNFFAAVAALLTLQSGATYAGVDAYYCQTDQAIGFQKEDNNWNYTTFDPLAFIVTITNASQIAVKIDGESRNLCVGARPGHISRDQGYFCDSSNMVFQFNPIIKKYTYAYSGGYAKSGDGRKHPVSIEIGSCKPA